jgi:hypothetical protein
MDVRNSLQLTTTSGAYDDDGRPKRTGEILYSIINNQLIFSVIYMNLNIEVFYFVLQEI